MDELQDTARSRWSEPRSTEQASLLRKDPGGRTGRPLRDLSIRDLIIELEKVEGTQLGDPAGERPSKSEQRRTRRESLILAELHRRGSLDPAPAT